MAARHARGALLRVRPIVHMDMIASLASLIALFVQNIDTDSSVIRCYDLQSHFKVFYFSIFLDIKIVYHPIDFVSYHIFIIICIFFAFL